MNLDELQKITKEVVKKFPGKQWKAEIRTLDLVEEVGELCNAILVEEGHKGKKRAKAELADSLVDILFDLILLADIYKVNLDKEYLKMIADIKKRQKEKQFN
jgi:NTP pyrophosphatase (non-canonical NTP hydrolase)